MRIFRYVFMLCGDGLKSASLVSRLTGDYTVDNPETVGELADSQGVLSISPPIEAITDDNYDLVDKYHAWFASFLEINHKAFAECGADDIRIFMEIFYTEGHQCNFEVFDRESISTFGRFKVALPISIYTLSEAKINEWAASLNP